MSPSTSRFPRAAYARRAKSLSADLADWAATYKTITTDEQALTYDAVRVETAEWRAVQLELLADELWAISVKLEALR